MHDSCISVLEAKDKMISFCHEGIDGETMAVISMTELMSSKEVYMQVFVQEFAPLVPLRKNQKGNSIVVLYG